MTFVKALLVACLMGSGSIVMGQTTTNILDNFNRNGSLNGSSPVMGDTNLVSTNWVCNSTYTTISNLGGRMVITVGGTGTSAYIPLQVTNGYVYTISVTQNMSATVGGTGDRWGAVGFDDGSGYTATLSTKGPWMLMKQSGHMEAYYNGLTSIYAGDNAGNAAGNNNLLQIVLDTTTPSAWTTAVKVNGVQKATKTLPSGFTANRVTFFAYGTISLTNSAFSVTSIKPTAPSMSLQPVGITNWAGVNGSLTTAASGAQPLSYQWYLGSTSSPLTAQTNSTLNFTPLAGNNSGSYFVIVTNYLGSVTSSVAAVHVETNSVMALTPSISVGAIPASGSDAASGISSTNTYLDALNFTTSGTPLNINGVTFSLVSATGTSASGVDSVNGGSWALSKTSVFTPSFQTATLTAGLSDGSLSTLLSDAAQLSGYVQIGDSITLTFNNLFATGQYRIRLFYASLSTNALPVTFTFNGRGSDEVANLDENLGASLNSSGAYYVDYVFTATTNFASATLATGVAGTGAVLAGAVLQQISAPLVVPAIVSQPAGFTNWMTHSNALAVSASGSIPLHYQWYQNGLPLDGQTNNLLSFSSLDATNDGTYRVVVTNIAGSVTSSVANVFVITNGVWGLTPSISVVQIPASGSDTAVGINPTNLYLAALDFGDDTTPLAINGVNFTQISVTGNGSGTGAEPVFSGTDTNYGAGWSLTASDSATDESGFGSVASGGAPVQADGNMAAMLTDLNYMRGFMPAGDYAKLTLSGLAPGAQYAFRYYYRQWNANDTPLRPVVFTFDGQGTNESAQVDLDAGGANYINYQFTAASTNLDVTMTVVNPGNGPHIYGVTLQQTAPSPTPPGIASQPVGFTNWVGYRGSLTVSANGSLPLGYQWYQNGSLLSGQTNVTLNFPSLASTDAGAYKVIVSNQSGSVTSSVVNVSVITNGVWNYTPSISVVQIPATGSDAASGIASTNTYLCALDFGDDTTPLAINGVNFMQVNPKGDGTGTDTFPVFSGVDANYGGAWSLTASNPAAGGFDSLATDYAGNVGSQADGNLQALLTDITYMSGIQQVGGYAKLTMGSLTPGAQYSLRYYYRQWGSARPIDFTFDGQGSPETVRVDLDAGGANYVNYNFTAASTNVSVTMTTDLYYNGPHIYGVTLQQTGTPPVIVTPIITLGAQSNVLETLQIIGGKYAPTDANGYPLTVSDVTQGTNGGTVAIANNGTNVTFISSTIGADSFTYTVSDGMGGTATGHVNVTVTAVVNQQTPQLTFNGSGNAVMTFWGVPGNQYTIQKSSDLITWTDLTTVTANNTDAQPYGQISYTDKGTAGITAGFYRLKP